MNALTVVEMVSATSTAGRTCASLTSSMAAIAAGPADSGTNTWSDVASATSARIMFASTSAISSSATGSSASMPSERARRLVKTRRGAIGAQSARNAASRLLVQPLDRQAEQRFVAAFDHHRPAGPELSQTPADAHLFTGSEQDGTACLRVIIWH